MADEIDFEGIKLQIPDTVYNPSEDSFLLAKYSRALHGRILDIGCGSGIQALLNGRCNPENHVLGVDLNEDAVATARKNAVLNNISNVEFRVSNLFSNVSGQFDGIIFNPPYLPTPETQKVLTKLNLAFDGGISGRSTTDQFLDSFDSHLNSNGTVLLLQSTLSNPDRTVEILFEKNYIAEIIDEEGFFFEKLYVLKAQKHK